MGVTILGANGFLGLNLIDVMVAAGVSPRCLHRPRGNLIPLKRRGVERVPVDLEDAATLVPALAGNDVCVHLAGHYPRDSRTPEATLARGCKQTQTLLDAAAAAGVKRFIYVSSTATVAPRADGSPSTEADVYPHAPGFGTYHDLKWAMEACVLAERRFEVLIACPGACLGPWDLKVGTSALLVGMAHDRCPPHPDGTVALVDARDVGRALFALTSHPQPPRRVLLAGHTTGLQTLLTDLAHHYGVALPSAPLTPEAACALADAEEARVAGTPERAAIAREIVDLVIHGVPVDAALATETLGIQWTPLSETLAAFDTWAARMRIIPAQTAAAIPLESP